MATGTSIDSDNSTSPKHLENSGTSSGTTTATAGKAVTSKASALGSTNTPTTSSNTVSTTGSSPANNGEPETLARLPETYHDLLRHGELVTLLPRLASLQQDMPQSLKNAFESFRTSAPSSCVLFWIWLENEFSTADNKDAALGILEQLGNFDSLLSTVENWDWALKNRGPKAAHELQKTAEQVQAFWNIAHPGVRQSLGEYLPKQLGEALLRRLLGCQQKNSLIVEDPEEPGRFVDGQIVGRNTKKSSWFGVILPSRNKPGYWRGYWLQGKRYHEAYKAYVKAATFTLSIAGDPEFLDECEPEDFEIVAVFQMKWGQTYHTHALGVPNFSPTQPPMLFSKSILASPWGKKRAETVIDGYLRNAGQTNYLAAACSGVDRVSTKAW